ncbi:MAG TPA: GerMN domain-containing protein [Verrucomicrobiae bacterium]|nr:GerMN domain-containing protein [Verrucomicrobiae bacterium]
MGRNVKIGLLCLVIGVIVGLISFRGLHRRVKRLAETQSADEKARHEVLAPPISTPTDVTAKAKIFWASGPDSVAPVDVELPLSADPVERSKQLLRKLISDPPSSDQRTLPADATLLDFYVLPDGTAVADFSDAVASEMPSGILSEQLAVDSIVRTLEINVPGLRRLKILIHGQEVDTLAGNVDLTGFFDLNSSPQQAVSSAPRSAGSPLQSPAIPSKPPATAALTKTPH